MKKTLFIFTAMIFGFTLMILSGPPIYASSTPDYLFDDYSETLGDKTLSVDAATQIWTINGTTASTTFTLPNLYAPNSQGFQLYSDRDYLVKYEYISGSMTGSNFRPSDFWFASATLNQEINIISTDMTVNRFAFYGRQLGNRSQVGAPNGTFSEFKYKLTIQEIDSSTSHFDVFDGDYTASSNNVSISVDASTSTIVLNGVVNMETSFDLKPYISTTFENGTDYLLIYKYVSGTVARTGTGQTNRYMWLPLMSTTHTTYVEHYTSNRGIVLNNFDTFFITPQASVASYTTTYTNLTYQVFVKDLSIEEEIVAPGETTTPPTGVFLNGSYYQGQIYYNRNQELDRVGFSAYNISTTTGNTFDLSLIQGSQLDFSLSGNTKFVAAYIAPDTFPDSIEVMGDDISISIVDDEIHIWHGDDIETFDEFSFLMSGFLEFYVLVEIDPDETPGTYDLFVDYTSTSNGLTLTIINGNVIVLNGTATTTAMFANLLPSITTLENGKTYQFTYEYVSGMTNASSFSALGFNGSSYQIVIPLESHTTSEASIEVPWSASITGSGISADAGTYSNLIYLINVEEVIVYHTVTFNTGGGSTIIAQEVADGELATIPTAPTRAGYVFQYWRDSVEVTPPFEFTTPITSDITLYAVWEEYIPETYTITFNSNGGTAVSSVIATEGIVPTAPTPPTKADSVFVGWYSNSGLTTLFSFSAPISADMTLYAKWVSEDVTVFTITFNSNGGSTVANMYVTEGELATAPTAPTRLGYTFSGWYKNIALTSAFSFIGDVIDADTTLYAKWTPVPSGGDPIVPETESATPWAYIALGVLALLVIIPSKKKRG